MCKTASCYVRCVCCRSSPHPDMLVCVRYRSAALYSSAVGRATYCRAPFLALVCPTSLGVVFNLSALVSTVCAYCYKYICMYREVENWSLSKVCLNKKSVADKSHICFLDPTLLPHLFFPFSLPQRFSSVAPLIPVPCTSLTPTLTCLLLPSSLVSLIHSSSTPLQPARAASPVWCESHWIAIPWLHAHLYMSAGILLGRWIRAQDLQVRWELDRETTSLCRYKHGYITSRRGHGDINYAKTRSTHLTFAAA